MKANAVELHDLKGRPFMVSPDDVAALFSRMDGFADTAGAVLLMPSGNLFAVLESYVSVVACFAKALKA